MVVEGVICFALLVILSVLGFILGFKKLSRMKTRRWLPFGFGCVLVILFHGFLRFHPRVEFRLIPLFLSSFFDMMWVTPVAILFFTSAAKKVSSQFASRGIVVLAALIFLAGVLHSASDIIGPGVDPQAFNLDEDGVCHQSTGHTCGAASAVTFLHAYGIEANEAEMARLSRTVIYQGVSTIKLARGILRKLKGTSHKIDIVELDWEGIRVHAQPCIVVLTYSVMVDHTVAILEVEEDSVIVGEPLKGKVRWSKEEFLRRGGGKPLLWLNRPAG